MNNNYRKPNFIVIGSARSGTTSLHKYLELHPDIDMSEIKEINFFSNPAIEKNGLDWYYRHFKKSQHKLVGEASTSYTVHPHYVNVAEKISKHLGNIKLIYILRDPIDRLLSHYVHHVHRGEIHANFQDLLNTKSDPMFIQGRYAFQLEQYLKVFDRDNIHILTIDDLKDSPQTTLDKLFNFLDVSNLNSTEAYGVHHNANTTPTQKSAAGLKILELYHKHIEQRELPYPFKKVFLNLAEIGSSPISTPSLSHDELAELKEYYRHDVIKLKKSFGVNTSNWRSYEN